MQINFIDSYQFAIVILAVATIFYIIQIIAGLFAQQAQRLRARHVKLLLAAGFIALHTGAEAGLRAFTLVVANVARLGISFGRHQPQNDRFHGADIAEPNFGYIQSAHDMRPCLTVVRSLQGAVLPRTQHASGIPFFALAFAAVPRTGWHGYDAIACLVHGNRAAHAIAVDQRILGPAALVRTDTTTANHFLHFSGHHRVNTSSNWLTANGETNAMEKLMNVEKNLRLN